MTTAPNDFKVQWRKERRPSVFDRIIADPDFIVNQFDPIAKHDMLMSILTTPVDVLAKTFDMTIDKILGLPPKADL